MLLCFAALLHLAFARLEAPNFELPEELLEYLLSTNISNQINIGVILYSSHCGLCEAFLKQQRYHTVVTISARLAVENNNSDDDLLVCFVDDSYDFERVVPKLCNSTMQFEGGVRFVVSRQVDDEDWLVPTLEYLWASSFLDFTLAFQVGDLVKVVGYNPFNRTVLSNTSGLGSLRNMYGHKLVFGMAPDELKTKFDYQGKLVGLDVNLGFEIGRQLNATTTMVVFPNTSLVLTALKEKKIQFSFCKFFTLSALSYSINPSYPIEMEYFCILTPTAELIPQYQYLFAVFTSSMWLSLLVALIAVIVAMVALSRCTDEPLAILLLTTLSLFVNIPAISSQNLVASRDSKKFLLTSWVFFSLLIAIAFNSELQSSLITLKYYPEAETIDEIAQSNLKILTFSFFQTYLPYSFEKISANLVNVTHNYLMDINMYKKDKGYIVLFTYAEYFVKKRDVNRRPIYKILPEKLAAAHNVYDFAKNSPYKLKIEKLLSLFRQLGLGYFGLRGKPYKFEREKIVIPLRVQHLQTAFYIVLGGNLLGAIALLLEIFHRYYLVTLAKKYFILLGVK